MKKMAGYALLFVAAFAGVFAALRTDNFLKARTTTDRFAPLSDSVIVEPAQFKSAPSGAGFDFRAAAKRITPSVVSVDKSQLVRTFRRGVQLANTGTGSGVIISRDGFVITNNHVIEGAESITVRLNDNRSFRAKLIGTDERTDLALLKIDGGNDFTPAELGDSSKLEVGQWVMAVGNPLGYSNTLSVGVVSSLGRTLEPNGSGGFLTDAIQTDAAINSGNSGGALTDDRGNVIGINTAIATPTGGSVGIGFSIPINRAKKIVEELRTSGRVNYGASGIRTYNVTLSDPNVRGALQEMIGTEPPASGLVVQSVFPGTPAERAGIAENDILQTVDGQKLNGPLDLFRIMLEKRAGQKVRVSVWRGGKSRDVTLDLISLDQMSR
jgi:serine protease Do